MTNANKEKGATVLITHRVREGNEAHYEKWLEEIEPVSRRSVGHVDWQVIRPVAGLTSTYSYIIRFDSRANLDRWMASAERAQLIEKVRPLLSEDDRFMVRSGLDFLFTDGAGAPAPKRWKQFLATWSALYPLSVVVPLLVLPMLRYVGIPQQRLFDIFCLNGIVVALMVYWVMPRYTKLIRHWLFK